MNRRKLLLGLLGGGSAIIAPSLVAEAMSNASRLVLTGSRRPTTAQRASAAKIIAAAAAYVAPSNMATAPTIASGTAGAASTINSNSLDAPTHSVTDVTKFRQPGPTQDFPTTGVTWGQLGAWSSQATITDGGQGYGWAFTTTGLTVFDMMMTGAASGNMRWRLRINGEWAQTADYSTAIASGTRRYIKVTLNRTVAGLVEIFLDLNRAMSGINVNVGATVTAPAVDPNASTAHIWGDSFVKGNAAYGIRSQPAQIFGQKMGILDIGLMGRAGQGYVLTTDSRTIAQRIPLDMARLPTPLLAIAYGSVNDFAQSAVTIQANVTTAIRALQAYDAATWIVFFSSMDSASAPMAGARNDACYNGALSVADRRTIVIDTIANGFVQNSTTGTLPNALPHDSPDGTHPGPNETDYLTDLMKSTLITALRARI